MEELDSDRGDSEPALPLEVRVPVLGAVVIAVFGGPLSLVYVFVGLAFGVAPIALLAVLLCAGFVWSAVRMSRRDNAGRITLSVLGVCFVPALPLFVTTFVEYVGDLDPRWWVVSTVIAVVVVVPAWLPGANRWFASGDGTG